MQRKYIVFAYSFLFAVAPCLLAVAMPVWADRRFHATAFEIGLLGSMGSLAYTAAAFFFGHFARGASVRAAIACAGMAFAAFVLIMPKAPGYVWFLLSSLGWQVALGLFWPVFMGWMASGLSRTELPAVLAIFNVAWCAGQLVGDYAGGILYGEGASLPFVIASIMSALAAFAALGLPGGAWVAAGPSAQEDEELPALPERVRRLYMYSGWASNLAGIAVLATIRVLFPAFGVGLGFSPGMVGLLLASMPAMQIAMFWLLGRWHGWQYRIWPLAAAQALGAAGCLLAVRAKTVPVFAVAFMAAAIAIALAYTASLFYSVHGRKDKARQAGIHEGIVGMGGVSGPLVMGAAANWHVRAPYALCGAFLTLLTIGQVAALLSATRNSSGPRDSATAS